MATPITNEAVEKVIEGAIYGTTIPRSLLECLFAGKHVCAILYKGHSTYIGSHSAYSRSEIKLFEYERGLGNERGQIYVSLHPEECRLTKKITEEAIEKARKFDESYLNDIEERKQQQEMKEQEQDTRIRWSVLFAEAIGVTGNFSHTHRGFDEPSFVEFEDKIPVKPPASVVLMENKVTRTVNVEVMFDTKKNPRVEISLRGGNVKGQTSSMIEATFLNSTPIKIREWLRNIGAE